MRWSIETMGCLELTQQHGCPGRLLRGFCASVFGLVPTGASFLVCAYLKLLYSIYVMGLSLHRNFCDPSINSLELLTEF